MGLRKNLLRKFQNYRQGKCYVNFCKKNCHCCKEKFSYKAVYKKFMYFYNKDVLEYAQTRANSKNQGLLQPAPGMHRFVELKMADSSRF